MQLKLDLPCLMNLRVSFKPFSTFNHGLAKLLKDSVGSIIRAEKLSALRGLLRLTIRMAGGE